MKKVFVFIAAIAIIAGCKKSNESSVDHTSGMGGVRNWHGTRQTNNYNGFFHDGWDTTLNKYDTFEIKILNNVAVYKYYPSDPNFQQILYYVSTNDSEKTSFFERTFFYFGGLSDTLRIWHNYEKDSMYFEERTHHRMPSGGFVTDDVTKLTTP